MGGANAHLRRERGPRLLCAYSAPLLLLLLQVREEAVLAYFEPLPTAALELELPGGGAGAGAGADGHERARL